ncbi:hypothetical protein I7I48_02517 [Histoplasma ohiense]|nr:hypothetical protein I7I48_02517 [Histoplasma ohiense (nom. inval.)]
MNGEKKGGCLRVHGECSGESRCSLQRTLSPSSSQSPIQRVLMRMMMIMMMIFPAAFQKKKKKKKKKNQQQQDAHTTIVTHRHGRATRKLTSDWSFSVFFFPLFFAICEQK